METTHLTAYDTIPYLSRPFTQTHPDRLATMATWFGMRPAPVERCRVLELGCGSGANIIPMALGLPESTFVGVDLARTAITEGQAIIGELGLRNIELRAVDVRAVPRDLAQFDYIVAHGIYAWVAREVQESILNLCAERLAPQGVAFVSYNTYPGSRIREMVREMMLFHIHELADPEERLRQALDFVRFLTVGMAGDANEFLRRELEEMLKWRREFVFHEHLAQFSEPLYFTQFVKRAQRYGLQYLAEARISDMRGGNFPPSVIDYLRRVEDARGVIEKEQYLDFLLNRGFRQTLLCHREVVIARETVAEAVRQFWIASFAEPEPKRPDCWSNSVLRFNGPDGSWLQSDRPLVKAAMCYLERIWPERARFEALLQQAQSIAGLTEVDDEHILLDALQQGFLAGVLELHMYAPPVVRHAGPRPEASPLARLEARSGSMLATLLHSNVEIEDEAARYTLQLLDGTRDRVALTAALDAWARRQNREPMTPDQLRDDLEHHLQIMGRLGLLRA